MKLPPSALGALAIAAVVAAGVAAAGSPLLALAVFGSAVATTLTLERIAARR